MLDAKRATTNACDDIRRRSWPVEFKDYAFAVAPAINEHLTSVPTPRGDASFQTEGNLYNSSKYHHDGETRPENASMHARNAWETFEEASPALR
jgi:hypothetical protein